MARRWYETERAYRRRLEEQRRRKRGQKKRKKKRTNPVDELFSLPRRALRRKLRSMTRKHRNKMRRQIRSRRRKVAKGMFGLCPVCAQPDTPGHQCRVRFTPTNARNIRNRLAKQGGLPAARQNPNLWRRQ